MSGFVMPSPSMNGSPAVRALGPREWADSPSHLRVEPRRALFTEEGHMDVQEPETVLEAAMQRDAAVLLRLLATSSRDVNERDASGRTALLWCCEYSEGVRRGQGRFDWTAKLDEDAGARGASLSPRGAMGPGPFERCVEALLAAGADPTVEDNHGSTAILLASFRNSIYSLECLLRTPHPSLRNQLEAFIENPTRDGRTPLLWAVAAGSKACAQRLLELGADVQHVDQKEVSALMLASYEEGPNSNIDTEMRCVEDVEAEVEEETLVQVLLKHGANVDTSDCNGRSSLFYAVMGASRDAAFDLLEHGAEVSLHDEHGVTPLLLAVDMGDDDMVRLLLSSDADVSATDAQGRTALAWACFAGFSSTARLLLEAGASPLVQDDRGMSPLMLAAFKGHFDSVLEIFDACDDETLLVVVSQVSKDSRNALLWAAASPGEASSVASIIQTLVSSGADVRSSTHQGSTALHLAAHKGNVAALVRLIACGADIFARDAAGRHVLHRAVLSGRVDAVAALVAGGGAPLLQVEDKQCRTPLVLATGTYNAEAVVRYLEDLGGPQRGPLRSVDSLDSGAEDA